MIYFQFLFYYLYKGYLQRGEKLIPGFITILFMSMLFSFNIISLWVGIWLFMPTSNIFISGNIAGILFILILSLNSIYFYLNKGKKKAVLRFSQEDHDSISRLKKVILFYIVFSILVMGILVYIRLHI